MRLETIRYVTGYIYILLVTNPLQTYTSRNRPIYNRLYIYITSYRPFIDLCVSKPSNI